MRKMSVGACDGGMAAFVLSKDEGSAQYNRACRAKADAASANNVRHERRHGLLTQPPRESGYSVLAGFNDTRSSKTASLTMQRQGADYHVDRKNVVIPGDAGTH